MKALHRFPSSLPCALAASLFFLTATGCSSFNLEKYIPSLTGRTGEFRRPLKVVAFWTDTVRTAEGQPAMRGFGGRLMFYDNQRGKSVKVAGNLVIYGFDESRVDQENPRPDRKFVFTQEQFAKHYSKSELGPSYSFWIPWDRVGGPTQEVSLICRFTPVEGGAVVSEQVKQLLPGIEPVAVSKAEPVATPVKLVQYQETLQQAAARRMNTTTIELNGPPDRRLPTAQIRPRTNWPSAVPGSMMGDPNAIPAGANVYGLPPGGMIAPPAGGPNAMAPAPMNPNAANSAAGQPEAAASAQAANGSFLARFGPHQSRVPGAPIGPPDRSRGPWRPTHVIPPPTPAPTTTTPNPVSLPAMAGATVSQ
ncbi:MAG TPA: hypothetical protein VHC22_04115 [Pirellulales bacterium]|nr:hypothetical protein [Pirellulales bacterium]